MRGKAAAYSLVAGAKLLNELLHGHVQRPWRVRARDRAWAGVEQGQEFMAHVSLLGERAQDVYVVRVVGI